MEKQRFLEKCMHGTPRFPIECFQTHSDSDHFIIPMHWHKNVEIMQIYRGEAELAIGTGNYTGSKGDILIINQEELHRIVSEDPSLHYGTFIFPLQSLSFEARDASQEQLEPLIRDIVRFPAKITPAQGSAEIGRILDCIMRAAEEKREGYELYIKMSLLRIVCEFMIKGKLIPAAISRSNSNERLKSIIGFIRKNYTQSLTLRTMAEEFHMSEKYFSRYFRAGTGQNFTAFLNAVRIEEACILLSETDRTVLDIAYDCGYENVSYFNRTFRAHMNMTPMKYRASTGIKRK